MWTSMSCRKDTAALPPRSCPSRADSSRSGSQASSAMTTMRCRTCSSASSDRCARTRNWKSGPPRTSEKSRLSESRLALDTGAPGVMRRSVASASSLRFCSKSNHWRTPSSLSSRVAAAAIPSIWRWRSASTSRCRGRSNAARPAAPSRRLASMRLGPRGILLQFPATIQDPLADLEPVDRVEDAVEAAPSCRSRPARDPSTRRTAWTMPLMKARPAVSASSGSRYEAPASGS